MLHRHIAAASAVAAVIAGLTTAGSALAQPAAHHVTKSRPVVSSVLHLSAAERAAVRRAAPRPPRVTNLAPYQDGSAVTLGWHNPNPALFRRVLVRYARGGSAPATPGSGTAVRLSSRQASAATLSGLQPNVKYSAAVWTRDAEHRLSHRTATSFITPSVHRGGFATISGSITDNTGQPLSGAVVSSESWSSYFPLPASTVTGDDGHYRLTVPVGEDLINIDGSNAVGGAHDATGYQSDGRDLTLGSGQHVTLNSALRPGGAMTGTVTDALGNPVSGVTVYASPSYPYVPTDVGNFSEIFQFLDNATTSRADGTFTLKGIFPDVNQACFDATTSGHLPPSPARFGYYVQCEDTPYSVHIGQVADTGTTTLKMGPLAGTLSGTVSSPSGKSVPGVFVTVAPVGRRFAVNGAQTDSSGNYSISGLKAGTYRVCAHTAQAPMPDSPLGYLSRCLTRHVTLSAGKVSRADIAVYPGGGFSGVVRAPDGTPVANAAIWLVTPNSGTNVTATDNRGRYTISGLRSGRYGACVDTTSVPVRGYADGLSSDCRRGHSRFVVRRGKLRIGVDFAPQPGAAIRGTVTEGRDHPVRWVSVYTSTFNGQYADVGTEAFAATGRHGHFKLLGLRPGDYQLCFENGDIAGEPRGRCPHRTVSTTRGTVANYGTMDLGPSGSIRAVVTDTAGHLLNGVDVTALTPCAHSDCDKSPVFPGQRYRVAASWTTYGDGTVPLTSLKPGNYAVCLFGYLAAPRHGPAPATGYADHCTSDAFDVSVAAGKTTVVNASLPLAGEVTGTVTDGHGNPLQNVRVKVSNSAAADVTTDPLFFGESPPGQAAFTAADGTYAVRSVAAGDQTVCFDAHSVKERPGFLNQCYGGQPGHKGGTPVSVVAGAVTSGVDISLTQLGRIAGSVVTATGKPMPKSDVFIFRPEHPRRALVGSPRTDGSYLTPGLRLGNYVVCFDARHYQPQCYNDVPWNGWDGKPLPSDATQVSVSSGATSSGIDAVLVHD